MKWSAPFFRSSFLVFPLTTKSQSRPVSRQAKTNIGSPTSTKTMYFLNLLCSLIHGPVKINNKMEKIVLSNIRPMVYGALTRIEFYVCICSCLPLLANGQKLRPEYIIRLLCCHLNILQKLFFRFVIFFQIINPL
jgi:hypothetical protein